MKTARFLLVLSLIGVCAYAASNKEISVKQDLIPGWNLGYEHLGILSSALEQKDNPRKYALHSIEDPMLTASMIVGSWQFSWKGDEYEILESDSFVKAQHRVIMEGMHYYKVLNYTIYSEKDDKFVMELEKVESPDGDVQFLVRPDGAGVVVDIFDLGEVVNRTYDELPAQYGYSNNKLKSLAHREEFSYCTFDSETLNIATFHNKAMREGDMLKILSKQKDGGSTETHLNQDAEVLYMISSGLKFQQCDVETALAER